MNRRILLDNSIFDRCVKIFILKLLLIKSKLHSTLKIEILLMDNLIFVLIIDIIEEKIIIIGKRVNRLLVIRKQIIKRKRLRSTDKIHINFFNL